LKRKQVTLEHDTFSLFMLELRNPHVSLLIMFHWKYSYWSLVPFWFKCYQVIVVSSTCSIELKPNSNIFVLVKEFYHISHPWVSTESLLFFYTSNTDTFFVSLVGDTSSPCYDGSLPIKFSTLFRNSTQKLFNTLELACFNGSSSRFLWRFTSLSFDQMILGVFDLRTFIHTP